MIVHDSDLVLPFQQAATPVPYSLPFSMRLYKREHRRFVMAHEDTSIPASNLAPREKQSLLQIFAKYPYAITLQEIQACLFTEGDLNFDIFESKSVRLDTLKWLGELQEIDGKSSRNLPFVRTKLVEILKEMAFRKNMPSEEEFIAFFKQAMELTLDPTLHANKILAVLDIVDGLETRDDHKLAEFYEDPSRTEEERQEVLQAIHNEHAERWNFRPAHVFIADVKEYGQEGAGGFATKGDPQNFICINRESSKTYARAMNYIFHEGTHIYQYDLIDMLYLVMSLRMDFQSNYPLEKNETEFIKTIKEIFPYKEGSIFHEIIYNDELRNYALICDLGRVCYGLTAQGTEAERAENYNYNPLEVLALQVGEIVEDQISSPQKDSHKMRCKAFHTFSDHPKMFESSRNNLYAALFRAEIMAPC